MLKAETRALKVLQKRQLKTHLLALALGASVQVFSLGFKCLGQVFKGRVKHVRSKRPLRTHMWSLRRGPTGGAAAATVSTAVSMCTFVPVNKVNLSTCDRIRSSTGCSLLLLLLVAPLLLLPPNALSLLALLVQN